MYSISRQGQRTTTQAEVVPVYLVAPEELISVPVLDPIPCMQELCDTMEPDVVDELFRVLPGERSTEG